MMDLFFQDSQYMPSFDLENLKQFDGIGTLIHQSSMPSTSDIAKETLLLSFMQVTLPMLVLCDQQTAGRGQPGKSWQANSQSLTFTWCVGQDMVPAANHALLPLIAGVSICEAFDATGIENAKLKWPNDVLIERKKVCGILVEKISSGKQSWFLIGIGINVNQTETEIGLMSQPGSRFKPESLRVSTGKEFEVQELLKSCIECLNRNTAIDCDWPKRCETRLDFIGENVKFAKPDGETFFGTLKGVDSNGRIRMKIGDETIVFASGHLSQA